MATAVRRKAETSTVLVADNDPEYRRQQSEAFTSRGFRVVEAGDPDDAAQRLLENPEVELAVVDLRLTDDNDDMDVSGLHFAKTVAPRVPKVIMTFFPTHATTRDALRPAGDGPSIVDYVNKVDGPEAVVAAARKALRFPSLGRFGVPEEAAPGQLTRQARLALAFLLLALGAGVASVVTEDPKWLFGTIALTILTVFFIGSSNR